MEKNDSGEASDVMSKERQAVEEAHRHLWEMLGGQRFEDVYQLAADEIASLRARLAEAEEERDRLRAALDVSNHYFRQMHQLVRAALE